MRFRNLLCEIAENKYVFRYLNAAKYNLRFSLMPHIFAALDSMTAAFPLELGLPFVGVVLLTCAVRNSFLYKLKNVIRRAIEDSTYTDNML